MLEPRGGIKRSLAYAIGGSHLGLLLQLIGTVVLSRLLTPSEVGVFAVAAVFTGMTSILRDFGVGEFIVQKPQLTDHDLRAALSLSLLISWGMGLLLLALAPALALFFREPGVADVLRVQALNFTLIPFGAVTMAWFRREMVPWPPFLASAMGNFTGLVVAITCAWQGLGYMSMAWASLAGVVVTTAVLIWFRPLALPRWPAVRGLQEVFAFGRFTGGMNVLNHLGRSAPEIIIGRVLNAESVAWYSRANALVEMFQRLVIRSVQPVSLPIFAQSRRDSGSPLRAYLDSAASLTLVGWPLLGFMALSAPSLIQVVYGPQWADAAALSRILCAAAAIELIHRFAREGALAAGQSGHANITTLAQQLARLVGLSAIVPFGLPGACWGLLAAAVAGMLLQQFTLARTLGLTAPDMLQACLGSLGIALLSCCPLALWLALAEESPHNPWWRSLAGAALTAAAWALCLLASGHPLGTRLLTQWRQHTWHSN